MRYSLEWRNHRREFHQFFHQRKVPVYQPIQLEECHAFLRRVLDDPTHLAPKIRICVVWGSWTGLSSLIHIPSQFQGSCGMPTLHQNCRTFLAIPGRRSDTWHMLGGISPTSQIHSKLILRCTIQEICQGMHYNDREDAQRPFRICQAKHSKSIVANLFNAV